MKNEKMSIMGINIIFLSTSIVYSIIIGFIHYLTKPLFFIKELPLPVVIIIGSILLIIGIPYYILSAKKIYKAYTEGKLCTTGVYATCRHPLYSSWIFFLIPGIIIFFRSWLLLTVPVFMYLVLIIFIGKEENYLKNIYGNKYLEYKNNTNLAFPKIWKILKK